MDKVVEVVLVSPVVTLDVEVAVSAVDEPLTVLTLDVVVLDETGAAPILTTA